MIRRFLVVEIVVIIVVEGIGRVIGGLRGSRGRRGGGMLLLLRASRSSNDFPRRCGFLLRLLRVSAIGLVTLVIVLLAVVPVVVEVARAASAQNVARVARLIVGLLLVAVGSAQ